jgi:hypothetical protein
MTAAAKSNPNRAKVTVAPLLPQQGQHLEPQQIPIVIKAYFLGISWPLFGLYLILLFFWPSF